MPNPVWRIAALVVSIVAAQNAVAPSDAFAQAAIGPWGFDLAGPTLDAAVCAAPRGTAQPPRLVVAQQGRGTPRPYLPTPRVPHRVQGEPPQGPVCTLRVTDGSIVTSVCGNVLSGSADSRPAYRMSGATLTLSAV